jgi:Zn-dependent protease/predicted transcriptional regulator
MRSAGPLHEAAMPLRGLRVGRIAGFPLHVHWSAIALAVLVALNLAAVALPAWHPGWSSAARWAFALLGVAAVVGSLALHELAHAVVARRDGRAVRGITLFALGGVTHIDGEPRTPREELVLALAGPATSIVLGIACLLVAVALGAAPTAGAIAAGGGAGTLLAWTGLTNLILGAFNLVPGFPLDGGRVFRAIAWWATGDVRKATRWAAGLGQGVAWTMIGVGVLAAFGGIAIAPSTGIWLMLIGWFLSMSARGAYQQVMLRRALEDVPVALIMRSPVETVSPDMPVDAFVRHRLLPSRERAFPVVIGERLAGMIDADAIERVPRDRWALTAVGDVMQPPERWPAIELGDDGLTALLAVAEHEQVPVVDHGRLLGIAHRADLLKRLALAGVR